MLKRWFSCKYVLLLISLCWLGLVHAETELGADFYQDKTKVVEQQIGLLKNRLVQAQADYTNLQHQEDKYISYMSYDTVTKQWLNWTKLDISVAKANLEGINIELSESQQTINLLEKDTQEIENQINVFSVFTTSMARNGLPNIKTLQSQLAYQKKLLSLEKTRQENLVKLQKITDDALQAYGLRLSRIENVLKSQTMLQLKEQQEKSEIDYQQQQNVWLDHLNGLHQDLKKLEKTKSKDKKAFAKLANEIFYATENINFMYMQMLITRYQDQIQQFKISISRSSSITLLNKVGEQTIVLGRQFSRLNNLLMARIDIVDKRKAFLTQNKLNNTEYAAELADLENQYKTAVDSITKLNKELIEFRVTLEQALQQELSARQGLVGFGLNAWLDLTNEIMLLPTLTFQVFKNLTNTILSAISQVSILWWLLFACSQVFWLMFVVFARSFIGRFVIGMPDHALGHINLKWVSLKLLHRVMFDIGVILNVYWFFYWCQIPLKNFSFIPQLLFVWLFFKSVINVARLCLVETVHDREGHDVRLYYRLKWTFLVGFLVTAITVFLHQLPLVYEIKDLFYRLFLLFLSVVSILLLKSRDVLTALVLHHVDERRNYFRRVVRLLTLFIPLTLLFNSLIGVFGFINFVLTISWYQCVFLLVMAGYLIVRGIFAEVMESISRLMIKHVTNGWLWTEAFLKPLDQVLRILLFLSSVVLLFFLYGWDRQSPVVERLDQVVHYHLVDVLNTSITIISIVELFLMIALLYWMARWTREFVYRFLLSRTKDLGVRNSIAILSQYTLISIGILVGLRVLGIDLRALTVVAGALAFGVGLGLRDLANNFACGFLLLLERPLRVGDTVTIGGHEGDVMHIGGRAVTIRTWDHMEVLVPNAEIFSKSFTNWTAKDNVVRTVITIKLHRTDSPHNIQALIYQTLAQHKDVLTDPVSEVFMKELVDEFIEFEVRYFINLRQVKSRLSVRSQVLISIWEVFDKHGIKPPYLQHEVHIKTGGIPPLLPSP